jgi:hypothetical protein
MSSKTHTALGIGATVALAVLDEMIPNGVITLLVVVGTLAVASALGGQRLPLFIRVFATGATFLPGLRHVFGRPHDGAALHGLHRSDGSRMLWTGRDATDTRASAYLARQPASNSGRERVPCFAGCGFRCGGIRGAPVHSAASPWRRSDGTLDGFQPLACLRRADTAVVGFRLST